MEKPAKARRRERHRVGGSQGAEAKRGFVLLPRRWVGGALAGLGDALPPAGQGYERYATTLAGIYMIAFVCDMLSKLGRIVNSS